MSTDSTATDQPAMTDDPTLESVYEQLETLTDRVEELEAEVERIEQLKAQDEDELVEVNADGDTAALTDIWIAGIPVGSILQNTTEKADRAQNRLDDVEEVASNKRNSWGGDGTRRSHTTPKHRLSASVRSPSTSRIANSRPDQKRARFIARDVQDYAEKAPAGLVLNSRTITKVITAMEGSKPHTQTVARVMDFLDEFEQDEVEQTKRRGKKLVVIDEEAADRYHDRCDRDIEQPPAGSVMS